MTGFFDTNILIDFINGVPEAQVATAPYSRRCISRRRSDGRRCGHNGLKLLGADSFYLRKNGSFQDSCRKQYKQQRSEDCAIQWRQ